MTGIYVLVCNSKKILIPLTTGTEYSTLLEMGSGLNKMTTLFLFLGPKDKDIAILFVTSAHQLIFLVLVYTTEYFTHDLPTESCFVIGLLLNTTVLLG